METAKTYDTSNGKYSVRNCIDEIIIHHPDCYYVIRTLEKDNVKIENILDIFIKLYDIIDWKVFEYDFYTSLTTLFLTYNVGIDNIIQISNYLRYLLTKYISNIKIFEDLIIAIVNVLSEIDNQILR